MIPLFKEIDWQTVRNIPIKECHTPLTKVLQSDHLINQPVYAENNIAGSITSCYLRHTVAKKLSVVAAKLYAQGYKLTVLDGWRPPEVQRALYQKLFEQEQLAYPNETEAQLHYRTQFFVSLPSEDRKQPSPHLTGGSVDVTLADVSGNILAMGSDFDEPTENAYTAAYESIDGEVKERRRLLYEAMINEGFTNLPTEWWHFDFGNQVWAHYNNKSQAIFGLIYPT